MRTVDISVTLDVSITRHPWSPRRLLARSGRRLVLWAVLAVAAIFFVVPIVWLLLETTRTGQTGPDSQIGGPLGFGSFSQLLANWQMLFSGLLGPIGTWLENSTLYSGSGVVIAVALGIPAGYGLATFDFIGRRFLLFATMIAMLIPSNALVLPLVLEAHSLHVLGSPLAVILPYGLFPFGVYIAYLYFNTPRIHGLLAAARIDGCNEWQAFRHVALALSTPVIALVVVLDFIASWTNYFLPWGMYVAFGCAGSATTSAVCLASRYPVTLGVAQQLMTGAPAPFAVPPPAPSVPLTSLQLSTTAPPSVEALLILVSCAPVIIVLVIAQRWIVSGRLQGVFV
jgi:multiple sugar transport system permease protein